MKAVKSHVTVCRWYGKSCLNNINKRTYLCLYPRMWWRGANVHVGVCGGRVFILYEPVRLPTVAVAPFRPVYRNTHPYKQTVVERGIVHPVYLDTFGYLEQF